MNLNRRKFLELAGGAAALAAFGGRFAQTVWAESSATMPASKPNIVLIVADDLGYGDVSCQGGTTPTPNIDSIGSEGVRFTSGYVTAPVCTPTRAGLMTGRYQQRFGFHNLPGVPEWSSPNFIFPASEKMIPAYLKECGYATGLVGKWHLGYDPTSHPHAKGFDDFYGILSGARQYIPGDKSPRGKLYRGTESVEEPEYMTDAIGEESVAFIEKNKAKPFFLYTSFTAVHTPLQATEKYLDRFADVDGEKKQLYAAMLSAMDDAVGQILDCLKANDLDKNTLVFFVSDNGGFTMRDTPANNLPFRGSKASLYEGGIRVPFMARWKGKIPGNQIWDFPVISLDILPTILHAAGCAGGAAASAPSGLDGRNLLQLLKDGSDVPGRDFFWLYEDQWAIRSGSMKLVKEAKAKQPELYDLSADPEEQNDLSAQKPEIVDELRLKFDDWSKTLPEPLYQYNELKPAGATRKGDEE